MVPGMFDMQIGRGKSFLIKGAGALGVFAFVFSVNPPELLRPATEGDLAAMGSDYDQGLYNDADRRADQILKAAPNNTDALNVKGGIAFYLGNYASAAEYFRKAHTLLPSDNIITSNYANAEVEIGGYQLAVDLFKSIDDGKADRSFTLGRAELYAGDLSDAEKTLDGVPATYWHGAAKVLEAAALMAQAQGNPNFAAQPIGTGFFLAGSKISICRMHFP
jgi:predicted Zn-dependent protease